MSSPAQPTGTPEWNLVGPTVEQDLRRLISRYGPEAVRHAAATLTKRARGRRSINDWPELSAVIESDAQDFLQGKNPFRERSDYSIAKAYAKVHPGQSEIATHQRIERKLKRKPYDRRLRMLTRAFILSRDGYPYAKHLRVLEELAQVNSDPVWQQELARATSEIADYQSKTGEVPDARLTMKQIRQVVVKPVAAKSGDFVQALREYRSQYLRSLSEHKNADNLGGI